MSHVRRRPSLALFALAILLAPALGGAFAQSGGSNTGTRVDFTLVPFRDTLFTAVDGAFRARFDDDGHVWYSTEGGLVHVDPFNETRELFTKIEGLPSSYALGLDSGGPFVYVGTDLGLAVIDRRSGDVTAITPLNSPLPDQIVQDVFLLGTDLWLGTRFFGVAVWNTTKPFSDAAAWSFKNTSTTTNYAEPVRRIGANQTTVFVASEGDGFWLYDRSKRIGDATAWTVAIEADGLPTNDVLAVTERRGELWIGTTVGLVRRDAAGSYHTYNKTHGMPDARSIDVDIIPTVNGTEDVFVATPKGLWQLEPETGRNGTRAQQNFGIMGSYIIDSEFVLTKGWLFGTNRGVSLLRDGEWKYFATGPTTGPTWGPLSYGATSASVGDGRGYLWFGSTKGLSAYRLPGTTTPGYWQNFGPWQNYPGSVVNWIDTLGNTTWFGTNQGTYGFEHESGRWLSKVASNSRNLVYGIEADHGELWIALFGDGLVMENLTTGAIRSWDFQTAGNPLPDQYITDVRADGTRMWLGASIGMILLDRLTGAIRGTYTVGDGIPGNGVVFRVEPDGAVVWVGTKDGGLARFNIATGKVDRVWNATKDAGFPGGQVRSMHREGGNLWVGTTEGLARVEIASGRFQSWNQTTSDLVQNYINGITSANGHLWVATLSGIQRIDLATLEFLPMHDGPGVVRATGSDHEPPAGGVSVSVRIESPRDRGVVSGVETVRGSAFSFGESIDSVEWRVDEGAWNEARGTESWNFELDATRLTKDVPVTIHVRAFSGNSSGDAKILVTPVAAPAVPLSIEEAADTPEAYANRPLQLIARVNGDEPLSARVFYKPAGTSSFSRIEMTRQGNLFLATIPARDMREGEMRYYLEAQSGLAYETAAGDAYDPTTLVVNPAPRLALAMSGPLDLDATAGVETRFELNVTNAGTEPVKFRLDASGARASWVDLPSDEIALEPAETRAITATLRVPAAAFADNTTLTFRASDTTGAAEPASARVPIRIIPTGETPPTNANEGGGNRIPLSPLFAIAALGVALAIRRRAA